ncbi:hypothetical protein VTJ04DRAFT_5787 [Mycothermus thermophilus]|uniref:uncharacterized protein n=1 Tax=Humicola insolens TaxID=85995 RepID=UPI00374462BD
MYRPVFLAAFSLSLAAAIRADTTYTNTEICNTGQFHSPFNPNLTTCLDSNILNPSAWHPWTHQPACIFISSPDSDAASNPPYCVFTSGASPAPNQHRPGGGFSVITTPDEASSALNPLRHALDAPFFAPEKLVLPRPYVVKDIPGKGKGAVATRKIEKGKALLVDPVRVLAAVGYPSHVSRKSVRWLLKEAVERLAEPSQVLGLSRKGTADETDTGAVVEDILKTNTFGVSVGGVDYMALFVDLSRFNHDCRPNAFIHFSETTLAMTVWAARDIEEGEEITITYSPAGMPSKERRDMLERAWGFKCECSLCTAPPEVIEQSDANRQEVRSLQDKAIELAQQGEFHKALESVDRLFLLADQEGMREAVPVDIVEIAARLYYLVGDLEKAIEWTRKLQHEISGYGVPNELGQQKLKLLDSVMKRLERELVQKKAQEEE